MNKNSTLKYIFIALLSFCAVFAVKAQPNRRMSAEQYIETYKSLAVQEMLKNGIPASITLAQGIFESDCGNSILATNTNNHFGIKCHGEWKGRGYSHDDDKPGECFRVYNTVEESYVDHSAFLRTRPRYSFLFNYRRSDYKQWAYGLKKAGYATNPQYPEKLINFIEKYDLHQFDLVSDLASVKPKIREEIQQEEIEETEEEPSMYEGQKEYATFIAPELSTGAASAEEIKVSNKSISNKTYIPKENEIREINGVKCVIVAKNTSFLRLANTYKLSLQKILKFNDLEKPMPIKAGSLVYLKKKKSEASIESVNIKKGQTLHILSQTYGVRLKKLFKYNALDLETANKLPVGTTIRLQN